MSALMRLTAVETRLFAREPMEWGFSLLLPPILLVILGAIPTFRIPEPGLEGLRVIDLYTPLMVALTITLLALLTLPQRFATYRDKQILRRMRVTPVTPATMLGAQLIMCFTAALVASAAVLSIAHWMFSVPMPENVLAYLLAYALTAFAMLSLGLLIASLAPTGAAAGAIGTVLLFPMLFLGGLWIPRAGMHESLRVVSDLSPMGAGVGALHDAAAGSWPQPLHLLTLTAWAALCGVLATRRFRWE